MTHMARVGRFAVHRPVSTQGDPTTVSPTNSKHFRERLEGTPDAVLVADEDGAIIAVNGRAEELFGYSSDDILGHKVEFLVPKRFRGPHVRHRRRYPGEAHERFMEERSGTLALRADGTEFPAGISLSPAKTKLGWLTVVVVRDLTNEPVVSAHSFVVPKPVDG